MMLRPRPGFRSATSALERPTHGCPSCRRAFAVPASGTFQYHASEAGGVKIASRDLPGLTTTLALVAKAGTRYQPLPGFTEGLERFAFMNNQKRTALRVTREVELLGGKLIAYHSRENLVIGAKFLREDLPYFIELLGDVATKTRYTTYEFDEEIVPGIKLAQKKLEANSTELAINSAHGVAFHRGLGDPLHPTSATPLAKYLSADYVQAYASVAYAKSNFALVANGAGPDDLVKWAPEFFADAPSAPPAEMPKVEDRPTKYYGGEERIAHASGNTLVIAFPGTSSFTAGRSYQPEIPVLAALLGGQPTVKWSSGFSLFAKAAAAHPGVKVATSHATYSDAGLLYTIFTGPPKAIRDAAKDAVHGLQEVAAGRVQADDVRKAVALAKFDALEAGEHVETGLELTGAGLIQGRSPFQIDQVATRIDAVTGEHLTKAAKSLLEGKATISAVGDLFVLPFAEELELTV
ncbi:MAG: ubiquinol-cytochrome c reductase core subunit 1 [Phylliscum demangeonii]|nr:MAG: ubiquinol-cytochrome c reductase core subunit 1 [Phylliscum demangeonii]